jgi:periplasmic divalent cation tolerance protein
MDACIIYVTAPDGAEAEIIGRTIVAERLAASVNVIPGMRTFYWWQGKLESGTEAVLLLKTRRELAERAIARLRALHPYECPCALVLPVESGNPAYLDWVAAETATA